MLTKIFPLLPGCPGGQAEVKLRGRLKLRSRENSRMKSRIWPYLSS